MILALITSAIAAQEERSGFSSILFTAETQKLPATTHADYAFAMAMYRQLGALASPAEAALPILREGADLGPWLWVSANMDAIRRLEDGRFLISRTGLGGQFHRDLYCWISQWPQLDCSDGRERRMSAPTPELLLFEDVEYRRRMRRGASLE